MILCYHSVRLLNFFNREVKILKRNFKKKNMGFRAKIQEIISEWKKVNKPIEENHTDYDDETKAVLAGIQDRSEEIEGRSLNWMEKREKLQQRLNAKVDSTVAAKTATSKAKPRVKGQEQRTRE